MLLARPALAVRGTTCLVRGAVHAVAEPAAAHDWRAGVPNALTIGRVLAIPVLAASFLARSRSPSAPRLPAIIFAACAATDWLDGFLARRWQVSSALGAFLDPVADKLLVCTCLVLLSGAAGPVVAAPTAVIVCREVAVSALREWMGSRGKSSAVAVGWWGKAKTATQMASLLLLLIAQPGANSATHLAGLALLYVATLLACTSGFQYAAAAWPSMSDEGESKDR